jgi:hypothetical protein
MTPNYPQYPQSPDEHPTGAARPEAISPAITRRARGRGSRTGGIKTLLAVASVAGTVGGWAMLANRDAATATQAIADPTAAVALVSQLSTVPADTATATSAATSTSTSTPTAQATATSQAAQQSSAALAQNSAAQPTATTSQATATATAAPPTATATTALPTATATTQVKKAVPTAVTTTRSSK